MKMKNHALLATTLAVLFFGTGFMFSGMQTITGYYSDPAGYGFHQIQDAYFKLAVSSTLMGIVAMVIIMRKLDRFFR
jgi:hypothetical protein